MSQESADAFALRIKQEKEFREIFDKIKDDKEAYYRRIKEEGYDFTVERGANGTTAVNHFSNESVSIVLALEIDPTPPTLTPNRFSTFEFDRGGANGVFVVMLSVIDDEEAQEIFSYIEQIEELSETEHGGPPVAPAKNEPERGP